MKIIRTPIFLCLLFASCLPYARTPSINKQMRRLALDAEVMILDTNQNIPSGAEYVGTLEVGERQLSLANLKIFTKRAKKRARQKGANIIKIEKSIFDKRTGQLQINTKMYFAENRSNISDPKEAFQQQFAQKDAAIKKRDSIPNNNYTRSHKGQLDFIFSLPHVNAYSLKPLGHERKSRIGFAGVSTGLDYYYGHKKSIRLVAGATVDISFPIPVPLRYYGVTDYFNSTYVALTHNHYFKKFSFGYGLHYSRNAWYELDYGEEFWRTVQYNSPPILTNNNSIGIATNCNYRIGKHLILGVNYQPSLLRIKPSTSFNYEHLVSLDFLWKWKLKK